MSSICPHMSAQSHTILGGLVLQQTFVFWNVSYFHTICCGKWLVQEKKINFFKMRFRRCYGSGQRLVALVFFSLFVGTLP